MDSNQLTSNDYNFADDETWRHWCIKADAVVSLT